MPGSSLDLTDLAQSELLLGSETYILGRLLRGSSRTAVYATNDHLGRRLVASLRIRDEEPEATAERYEALAQLDAADDLVTRLSDLRSATVRTKGSAGVVDVHLEAWVPGLTMADRVLQRPEEVTPSLIAAYVGFLAEVAARLRPLGLKHTQLDLDAVVLRKPPPNSVGVDFSFRLVDLAYLELAENDHDCNRVHNVAITKSLIDLHNVAIRRPQRLADRRFLAGLAELIERLLDEGESSLDAAQLGASLPRLLEESERAPVSHSLSGPFVALSAEQTPDDVLLRALFTETLPWLDKAAEPEPSLVVGPRGCGKSTLFRWLSLRPHIAAGASTLPHRLGGFYVSCQTELQPRLRWIDTHALATKFRREIVHIFNLFYAREVALTFSMLEAQSSESALFGTDRYQQLQVWRFMAANLETETPTISGVSRYRQLVDLVDREIADTVRALERERPTARATGEAFLSDLADLLVTTIPFFQSHRVTYLLDDFSAERLNAPVQQVLNGVIWQRARTHIFKVSTDHYGIENVDLYGGSIAKGRERTVIDCGREFLGLDKPKQRESAEQFTLELIRKRLQNAGYSRDPEELLGYSEWRGKSLGRGLRARADGVEGYTGRRPFYYGLDILTDLCSGDVASILMIADEIFRRAQVDPESAGPVDQQTQHEAITDLSREAVDAVRSHYPLGAQMRGLLREYGEFMREMLLRTPELKQGKKTTPSQIPRIEVDNPGSALPESLPSGVSALYRELIRRAVFIQLGPGRARHNDDPSLRLHVRRIFLPSFGVALAKTEALKLSPAQFERFLAVPSTVLEPFVERRKAGAAPDGEQLELYESQ